MNAIYILWLRELKRYYRSKSRMIGSLGQPLLFLLALGFGLGPIFQKAGQGSYFQFLGPGVISMSILFTAIFSGIQVIWDKQFGFLKETLVAPVPRLHIMLGKTFGGGDDRDIARGCGVLSRCCFRFPSATHSSPTDFCLYASCCDFLYGTWNYYCIVTRGY